jgi:hypothetical protein
VYAKSCDSKPRWCSIRGGDEFHRFYDITDGSDDPDISERFNMYVKCGVNERYERLLGHETALFSVITDIRGYHSMLFL